LVDGFNNNPKPAINQSIRFSVIDRDLRLLFKKNVLSYVKHRLYKIAKSENYKKR